jgi:hypothetical protein
LVHLALCSAFVAACHQQTTEPALSTGPLAWCVSHIQSVIRMISHIQITTSRRATTFTRTSTWLIHVWHTCVVSYGGRVIINRDPKD